MRLSTMTAVLLLALVAMALAFTACGGDEENAPTASAVSDCLDGADSDEPQEQLAQADACLEPLATCAGEGGLEAEANADARTVRILTSPGTVEASFYETTEDAAAAVAELHPYTDVTQAVADRVVISFEAGVDAVGPEAAEIAEAEAQAAGAAELRRCLEVDAVPADTPAALAECTRAAGLEIGELQVAYGGAIVVPGAGAELTAQFFEDAETAETVMVQEGGLGFGDFQPVTDTIYLDAPAGTEDADAVVRACLEAGEPPEAEDPPEPDVDDPTEPEELSLEPFETKSFSLQVPAGYTEAYTEAKTGTRAVVFFETLLQSRDGAYVLTISRTPGAADGDKLEAARAFIRREAKGGTYTPIRLEAAEIGPYEGADVEYELKTGGTTLAITSFWFGAGADGYVVQVTADAGLGGEAAEGRRIAEAAAESLEPS